MIIGGHTNQRLWISWIIHTYVLRPYSDSVTCREREEMKCVLNREKKDLAWLSIFLYLRFTLWMVYHIKKRKSYCSKWLWSTIYSVNEWWMLYQEKRTCYNCFVVTVKEFVHRIIAIFDFQIIKITHRAWPPHHYFFYFVRFCEIFEKLKYFSHLIANTDNFGSLFRVK